MVFVRKSCCKNISDPTPSPPRTQGEGASFPPYQGGTKGGNSDFCKRSNDICELKRMWFLKAYRGRGLGTKMAQMLLDFATKKGYKKVRLDTTDEQKQAQAIQLYQRLGFYFIERYNDSSCTRFMEKILWKVGCTPWRGDNPVKSQFAITDWGNSR